MPVCNRLVASQGAWLIPGWGWLRTGPTQWGLGVSEQAGLARPSHALPRPVSTGAWGPPDEPVPMRAPVWLLRPAVRAGQQHGHGWQNRRVMGALGHSHWEVARPLVSVLTGTVGRPSMGSRREH